MKKFRMLVLTDHRGHSKENSLYKLLVAIRSHPRCAQLDVATRSNSMNNLFFEKHLGKSLQVSEVGTDFAYHPSGRAFQKKIRRSSINSYDAIWLRMPPPLSESFLSFLANQFRNQLIINDPQGIWETGSKAFLLNFAQCCPPMQLCRSVADIKAFAQQFPIVLKPLRDYGGKGIVKIDADTVWNGDEKMPLSDFLSLLDNQNKVEYLAVRYLKNVSEGDKRIIIIDGEVMGASLRRPAKDSWLCNVAQGGTAELADVDADELSIIKTINPTLSQKGIVMYGVDTLVGDDGRRVLSEINTTSIGGLPQMAEQMKKPLVKQAADLIWNYVLKNTEEDVASC